MDYGTHGFSECFKLADLGCSSGSNALFLVSNIIGNVHALCQKNNLKAPDEFHVFFNDLPNNDFNALFKTLQPFYSKLKNERGQEISVNCFLAGVPGSFYARLFPRKSLHFVYSSCSIHWLSQVPENLVDNNKGNIYMAKSNSRGVHEAYLNQFKKDFTTFLHTRSEEIVPNGRMVLSLLGRSITDPTSKSCCYMYELLAKSLEDLLTEGLLHEEDINSFNVPIYTPCTSEVKAIIDSESSFSLDRLETFESNWDTRDENEIMESEDNSGKFMAKTIRAVMEPLLVSHFGHTCIDELFERYAINVTEHLSREKTKYFTIVISLTRKCN